MKQKIPKILLRSKYRKDLWNNTQKILKKLEKVLPISSIYLIGSFATKKKRPADIDFVVLLKTKDRRPNVKWEIDLPIVPDNKYGHQVLEDVKLWMKQKYGSKNSTVIKLK